MDAKEEQQAELEALEAIFGEDFHLEHPSAAPSETRFSIEISSDESRATILSLKFTHVANYPDAPIVVVVHVVQGLSTPQRRKLQEVLNGTAADNVQLPSAFTVCEAAREWLSECFGGEGDGEEEEEGSKFETLDATVEEKVEVISSKAVGTQVSVENFAAWREVFVKEMEMLRSKEEIEREGNCKLTGRQLFESKSMMMAVENESFWEAEAGAA